MPKPVLQDGLEAKYANYSRVAHTRFEFVIDFGLLTPDDDSVTAHTRIVTHPVSALALYRVLASSIHRYRTEYGAIAAAGEDIKIE